MAEYWVSTPAYTALVIVSNGGRILDCAPILRRQWLGRSLGLLLRRARGRWGKEVRVARLENTAEPSRRNAPKNAQDALARHEDPRMRENGRTDE